MGRRRRLAIAPDDYHRYRQVSFDLAGQQYTVITKPGIESWHEPHPATELLMEAMTVESSDRVLVLGCGVGSVGLVAAQRAPEGRVCLVDRNIVAVEAARRTLALNRAANAEVCLSDCGSAVHGQAFDLVAIHAPREKEVVRQCVRDAAILLRPGGRCYLAGANRSGVKPAIRYLEEIFGQAQVLGYKGGSRVALAVKGERTRIEEAASKEYYSFREFAAQVRGKSYIWAAKPGLFSWDGVDEGTRRLVENMEMGPQDRVLELGCGYGLAGLVAAGMACRGKVVLLDADCVAVEAAQRTLARNEVANAQVVLSDCGAALLPVSVGGPLSSGAPGTSPWSGGETGLRGQEHTFDVVITNPPFHQGRGVSYQVARQFIRDAVALLRPGGRLYLVANRFIPYGGELQGVFQEVGFAYRDNRFQVWRAVRGRALGKRPRAEAAGTLPEGLLSGPASMSNHAAAGVGRSSTPSQSGEGCPQECGGYTRP